MFILYVCMYFIAVFEVGRTGNHWLRVSTGDVTGLYQQAATSSSSAHLQE